MPKHGKSNGANGQNGNYNAQETRERQAQFVSSRHGLRVHISDCDPTRWEPKSAFLILLGQLRSRRKQQECLEVVYRFLRSDWDAALIGGHCGEDQELALRQFLQTETDGRFKLTECGLPDHMGYCRVGRDLHRIDPIRFPSMKLKKDQVPRYHQQLVKDLVLRAFCTEAHFWWQQQDNPVQLNVHEMIAIAGFYFGDPTHRVMHRANLNEYLPLTEGKVREGRLKYFAPNVIKRKHGDVVLFDPGESKRLETAATALLKKHGFDEKV